MKKTLFLSFVILMSTTSAFAQGVAINMTGNDPDTTAMLDIASSSKGLLIPRLTTAGRDSIISPASGLLIFNKETNCFNYYSSGTWLSMCGTQTSSSSVPKVHTYTTDTVWTKPIGLKYIVVEMVGGGGGGSGTGGSKGVSSAGGGGGGYTKKYIHTSELNSSENIIIGIGGAGGAETGQSGQTGGTSSFGNFCSATGGHGGLNSSFNWQGGVPGNGIGGTINFTGNGGAGGGNIGSGSMTGAAGGGSFFCGGGAGAAIDSNGWDGTSYGGGGAGGSYTNSIRRYGGNGSNGIVIITEYY